uniref:Tick transposon n=1 Tax=Rhipicephalus appendiculatus TaxID=34631 RepID=A0A131Z346_RHIAP
MGVVYEVPLSCGRVYIGQTGQCVNDRTREHDLAIKNNLLAYLSVHSSACGCQAKFDNITILGRSEEVIEREMLEAYLTIKKKLVLMDQFMEHLSRFLDHLSDLLLYI